MGCFCLEEIKEPKIPVDASIFNKKELIKDGLDVYEYENLCEIFFKSDIFICPLCNEIFPEAEKQKIVSLKRKDVNSFLSLFYPIRESISEINRILNEYDKMVEEEEYLKLYIININVLKQIKKFICIYILEAKQLALDDILVKIQV